MPSRQATQFIRQSLQPTHRRVQHRNQRKVGSNALELLVQHASLQQLSTPLCDIAFSVDHRLRSCHWMAAPTH